MAEAYRTGVIGTSHSRGRGWIMKIRMAWTQSVPRASEKEGQVRLDYSPAPTQLALLSQICIPRSKRPIAATRRNPR
jgi:hypothetical protein